MSWYIFILSTLPLTAAVMLQGHDHDSQSTTGVWDWNTLDQLGSDPRVGNQNLAYKCTSNAYKKYMDDLSSRKFSLKDLRLPPNKKILVFGHSYMVNLWMNIATANVKQMTKFENRGVKGGYWKNTYKNGAEVVIVQNYEGLQTKGNIGNLKHLMSQENFDLSFFMNPHMQCWFDDKYNRKHFEGNTGCESTKPDPRLMSESGRIYWDVIFHGTNGKTIEIAEWNSREERKLVPHNRRGAFINGLDSMEGFGCNVNEDCKNQSDVIGHQCLPGALTLVAEEVAKHFQGWPPAAKKSARPAPKAGKGRAMTDLT